MRLKTLIDDQILAVLTTDINILWGKITQEEVMNATANTILTAIESKIAPILVVCDTIYNSLTAQMLWMLLDNVVVMIETLIINVYKLTPWCKDYKGQPVTIEQFLGGTVHEILLILFGAKEGDNADKELKKRWQAANKIFQAAANVLNAFQMIGMSVLTACNVIGSWNAQIGNAIKKYGLVGHLGFGSFNPAPNFQNRVFTMLSNAMNMISNLDQVTQSIQLGRTGVEQMAKESDAFWQDFTTATGTIPPEHQPTATAAAKAKADSTSPKAVLPTTADVNNIQAN
jgi:hypothetical protein